MSFVTEKENEIRTVMVFCNSLDGFYDFRNELALALLPGYRVIVCAPDVVRKDELENEGCMIINTPMNRRGTNPVEDIRLFRQYKSLLKEYRPSVVLTYTIKPNIYGGYACRRLHIPYIANITGLGSTFERGGMVQKLVTVMYRNSLREAKCLFFQNEHNRDIVNAAGIHGEKCRMLPGSGVNMERHSFQEYPSDDKCMFLFVGRIMKEKGIEEFIAAASEFHGKKAVFGIAGYYEEGYKERIDRLCEEGILEYYGFHTDMESYYGKASAVIVPSYHEGMSNVILEASATGRPVIASDISGCREAVEDGMSGLLFRPRDSRALCDAVGRFLSMEPERRAEMGRNARKKMEQEFDRRLVVGSYMEEIKAVIPQI